MMCSICYDKVCPSICLCITLMSRAETVQDNKIDFTIYDIVMFTVPWGEILQSSIHGFSPNKCVKKWHFLSTQKMGPIISKKLEMVRDDVSYYYTGFWLVSKSVTLSNLERHNVCYFVLLQWTRQLCGPVTGIPNSLKLDRNVCGKNCSSKNLLFENIPFTAMFEDIYRELVLKTDVMTPSFPYLTCAMLSSHLKNRWALVL